uniref:Uncharacterized protein n=1 Tax=Panagrolaimus sp. ES5 TaxID=591445 RepID=A0AC34GS52_9BILA
MTNKDFLNNIRLSQTAPPMSPNNYPLDFEDNSADDADLLIKRNKRGWIKDKLKKPWKQIAVAVLRAPQQN